MPDLATSRPNFTATKDVPWGVSPAIQSMPTLCNKRALIRPRCNAADGSYDHILPLATRWFQRRFSEVSPTGECRCFDVHAEGGTALYGLSNCAQELTAHNDITCPKHRPRGPQKQKSAGVPSDLPQRSTVFHFHVSHRGPQILYIPKRSIFARSQNASVFSQAHAQ
jgi:hypothetical protein